MQFTRLLNLVLSLGMALSLIGCSVAVQKEIAYEGKYSSDEELSPEFAQVKTLYLKVSATNKDWEPKLPMLIKAIETNLNKAGGSKKVVTTALPKTISKTDAILTVKLTDYDFNDGSPSMKFRWATYKDGKAEAEVTVQDAQSQKSLGKCSLVSTPSIDETSVGTGKFMIGGGSNGGEELMMKRLATFLGQYLKLIKE
ncbi:MAG: hypothetical protein EB078_02900 [Proteobacteria bacterium]|nr:hypothetical protein [Pseudomonadota bacterium]NDC23068.1 hypothetical protein [Pseudomonadota bacterium]NDD03831.1 hypothetical protein [Pseudomonadota bacterium]NDG25819.1 hypothetical protein [Pseudomonadota bacterium]